MNFAVNHNNGTVQVINKRIINAYIFFSGKSLKKIKGIYKNVELALNIQIHLHPHISAERNVCMCW